MNIQTMLFHNKSIILSQIAFYCYHLKSEYFISAFYMIDGFMMFTGWWLLSRQESLCVMYESMTHAQRRVKEAILGAAIEVLLIIFFFYLFIRSRKNQVAL